MDHDRLTELIGRIMADAGATGSAGVTVIGNRLGLYAALAEGPATSAEFAHRTGYAERYLREWLRNQAAGGYVSHDAASGRYHLDDEQAYCFADPNGPNFSAMFLVQLGYLRSEPRLTEAFRTGEGVPWHEHHEDVHAGVDAFFRPGYVAELVPNWIPALEGVHDKLAAGARVADLGCGFGSSSVLIAQEYPRSTVVGSDYHAESIAAARTRAARAGVDDRVRFEVATAQTFTGSGFELVTMFDALHDMGDPVGAARRVREAITDDGTWLLVEPNASDVVEENFHTIGRLYYAGSTFLCVPNGLSQEGGYALGAQAGEGVVRDIAAQAGFTRFRRAAESPVNVAYEIRP